MPNIVPPDLTARTLPAHFRVALCCCAVQQGVVTSLLILIDWLLWLFGCLIVLVVLANNCLVVLLGCLFVLFYFLLFVCLFLNNLFVLGAWLFWLPNCLVFLVVWMFCFLPSPNSIPSFCAWKDSNFIQFYVFFSFSLYFVALPLVFCLFFCLFYFELSDLRQGDQRQQLLRIVRLVAWLVSYFVACLNVQLLACLFAWLVACLITSLVAHLVIYLYACLVRWLVAYLVGCLIA